ncbi:ketopantoate reductase family protein [Psychromonas ossibalaenae]|uniref:ketopantoate reductase family protein n=1 Tax=Psychromonas ossibalaenae TaxID=444922 RepID=UPI000375BA18|nr:2-dehydropantoate 2-reductase [Psychromonas ossibalaenae]
MWQIIGAGAIGCLWAANLQRIGQQVHLITRKPCSERTLHYLDLENSQHQFNVSSSTGLLNDLDPLLVCVKATQVKKVIQKHLISIKPQQVIILMHNGMGCAEQVQALLPDNPIICATTANASLLLAPLNIKQTGRGVTYLGPFNPAACLQHKLAESLNSALDDTHWCENINHKLWLKLLINIAINPLTAIYQINNGQLLQAKFQKQIKEVIRDSLQIADAEKIPFVEQELLNTINRVIQQTAQNYSSMNRDIFYQRITENEYIGGFLLKKASLYKIKIPAVESLYKKIKQLESHYA